MTPELVQTNEISLMERAMGEWRGMGGNGAVVKRDNDIHHLLVTKKDPARFWS